MQNWLKLMSRFFEGTNTLIIRNDCAASKDVGYDFDPNTPWYTFEVALLLQVRLK